MGQTTMQRFNKPTLQCGDPRQRVAQRRVFTNHLDLYHSRPIRTRSYSEGNVSWEHFVSLTTDELRDLKGDLDPSTRPFRLRNSLSECSSDGLFDELSGPSRNSELGRYARYLRSHPRKTRLKLSSGSSKRKKGERSTCFQALPLECKLKVFSHLGSLDKGRASQVCQEWNELIRVPLIWNSIDFTSFTMCTSRSPGHACTKACYEGYVRRVKGFMQYLQRLKPYIHSLSFEYDLANPYDRWKPALEDLLHASNCRDLTIAHLNWTETPVRPFWLDKVSNTVINYKDFLFQYRHRQRLFVHFFDFFTRLAPKLSTLVAPFDWSTRSIDNLSRLTHLKCLVLEKYFMFQTLNQSALDDLLAALKCLRRLCLEVWFAQSTGQYSLASQSLVYLDVSQCRGFHVGRVALPRLRVIRVSRQSTANSSQIQAAERGESPCLYEVLSTGAPQLQQINDHRLQPDWLVNPSSDLERLLTNVCSCPRHAAMEET